MHPGQSGRHATIQTVLLLQKICLSSPFSLTVSLDHVKMRLRDPILNGHAECDSTLGLDNLAISCQYYARHMQYALQQAIGH